MTATSLVHGAVPVANDPAARPCIPRRIIQTGRNTSLSPLGRGVRATLQALNPDFEYVFFDDAAVRSFVRTEFPEYERVFDGFPFPIQRYDFFRYLAVYRLGGFYLDLDVVTSRPLEDLRSHGCVFPFESISLNRFLREAHGIDWELGNYAFGAAAGHPFMRAVIDGCLRAQAEPEWVAPMLQGIPRWFQREFVVLNTTGPGLVTRTFAEQAALQSDVAVLFPADVCDPAGWNQFGEYGVHLMDGSWRHRSGRLWRRLADRWEAWALARCMAASRALGPRRQVGATATRVPAAA